MSEKIEGVELDSHESTALFVVMVVGQKKVCGIVATDGIAGAR